MSSVEISAEPRAAQALGHPRILDLGSQVSYLGVRLDKHADTALVPDRSRFREHVITDFDALLA